MKLKMQDEKDQEFSVQKLIAATKPTKLAYKILIRKKFYLSAKESRKMGKGLWPWSGGGSELEDNLLATMVVYDQH